jgi:hypothetical protein
MMDQRCCIECQKMDRAVLRHRETSLVRCLDDANKEGVWHKLVMAGSPACKLFQPRQSAA